MVGLKENKRPLGSGSQALRPGKKAPNSGTRFQAALMRIFPDGIPRRSTPRSIQVTEVDEVFDSDDLLEEECRPVPDRNAPQRGPGALEVVTNVDVSFTDETPFVDEATVVEEVAFLKQEAPVAIETVAPLAPEGIEAHTSGDAEPSLTTTINILDAGEQPHTSPDTEKMVVEEIIPTIEHGFPLMETTLENTRAASEGAKRASFSPTAPAQEGSRGSSAQLLSRRSPRPRRRIIQTLKAREGFGKRIGIAARPQLHFQTDTAAVQDMPPVVKASPTPTASSGLNVIPTRSALSVSNTSPSPIASSLSSGSPLSSAPPSPSTPPFLSAPPSQAGTRDNDMEPESPTEDCIVVKPLAYTLFFGSVGQQVSSVESKRRGPSAAEAAFVGSQEEKEQLITLYLEKGGSMKHVRRRLRFSRTRGREDTHRLLGILEEAATEGRIELLGIHKKRIRKLKGSGLLGSSMKMEIDEMD
ncbi:hypothetical protein B0T16DRAFT_69038 [Cercophora newfieldiana]|uniref:DNAJC9 HTH domain-containing protein n=1 Tax=Cercophora newfieldiana TaxID=92897 RepID=A0AA39YSI8_9PEZI|nr:hypothetical protein B0T16DRAFT_69038 [Cercophora newfieldiana]